MLKQLSLSLLSICLSLVMVAGHLVGINLSAVSVAAQTKDGQLTVVPINSSEGRATAKSTDRQSIIVSQLNGVPMVVGTTRVVNNGPGNQSDPHVQGDLVSYTNDDLLGTTSIRYFDLATNTDYLVPGNGADSESEVNTGLIAFTEATPLGSQIVLFNTA